MFGAHCAIQSLTLFLYWLEYVNKAWYVWANYRKCKIDKSLFHGVFSIKISADVDEWKMSNKNDFLLISNRKEFFIKIIVNSIESSFVEKETVPLEIVEKVSRM